MAKDTAKMAYIVGDMRDQSLSNLRGPIDVHPSRLGGGHTRTVDGQEATCYQLGWDVVTHVGEDNSGIYIIGDTLYGVSW